MLKKTIDCQDILTEGTYTEIYQEEGKSSL